MLWASAAQLALTLSRSELDLRLALEESGREDLQRRPPQALQEMLNAPGLVLARPDWLREFMLWIYIGAPAPHPAPQSAIETRLYLWRLRRWAAARATCERTVGKTSPRLC